MRHETRERKRGGEEDAEGREMQKEIVKGDGCLQFLAHLYYCITRVLRPLCIFSPPPLSYAGLSRICNFNFFDEIVDFSLQKLRRKTLSMPIIFVIGLKNSWLEMSRIFYTFIVCMRSHINRNFLNNIVILGILSLKRRGTGFAE